MRDASAHWHSEQATLQSLERDPMAPATETSTAQEAESLAPRLAAHCAAYRGAAPKRAILQVIVTGGAFLALCAAMLLTVDDTYWPTALLTLPTAGLLVRLFIIQHDCGHGSYLGSRAANDRLGLLISLVTLTPYEYWRQTH